MPRRRGGSAQKGQDPRIAPREGPRGSESQRPLVCPRGRVQPGRGFFCQPRAPRAVSPLSNGASHRLGCGIPCIGFRRAAILRYIPVFFLPRACDAMRAGSRWLLGG